VSKTRSGRILLVGFPKHQIFSLGLHSFDFGGSRNLSGFGVLICALMLLGSLPALAAQDAVAAPAAPVADTATSAPIDYLAGVAPAKDPAFLGIPVARASHEWGGYVSGGLLAAASVAGLVRYLDMESRAHAFRTRGQEDFLPANIPILQQAWADGQWLRWTHVGLLAAGETVYLFNTATGVSMFSSGFDDTSQSRLHRYLFFGHLGLMAAEVGLGFWETYALEQGQHELVTGLGGVHLALGFAIPALILGSGIVIDFLPTLGW
jgi:hypothetical protein